MQSEKLFPIYNETGKGLNFRATVKMFMEVQPIFYSKEKYWWAWNIKECKWEIVDEIGLMNIFDDIIEMEQISLFIKSHLLEAMKREGRKKMPKKAMKSTLQFKDIFVNAITGETGKATPEYFVTNPIPWKIGKSEKTPVIDKLFNDWVCSEEEGNKWVQTLYEMCAYCLLPDYPIKTCFTLIGKGRNGKTTFLDFLPKFVGEENATTADLKKLATNQFEAWNLHRKLICNIGEIDFSTLKDTRKFKQLVGDDWISFEEKGKTGIIGKNYAKIIIAANNLPSSYDKSDGFFRKWICIDFPNKFKEKTNLLKIIPNVEYENLCKKSIRLLGEMLKRGNFTNQGTVAERAERYEERSSPFTPFLNECCVLDSDRKIPFWKLYNAYCIYLEERGITKQSKIEFGKKLKKKGFEKTKPLSIGKETEDGKMISWVFIKGIDLNSDY